MRSHTRQKCRRVDETGVSQEVLVRVGLNLLAWSGTIGKTELELIPRIASLGYDGVEVPIFGPDAVDVAGVARACRESGIATTASTSLPRGASLLERAERERGVELVGQIIGMAADFGATILCGPVYAPVGALPGRPRTLAEWDSCILALRRLGDVAQARGVVLALEPLNRFETHFLNTAGDALLLLDEVDHPAVGLHLDTFHMNIEEKSLVEAVRKSARHLKHVHFSANDRGVVGSGHVDWDGVVEALREIGYDGWVVAETFAGSIPEIAAATAIWRPIVPDTWAYARESLEFMRRVLA